MVVQVSSRFANRREWLPQSTLLYEDEYIWLAVLSAVNLVLTFAYLRSGGELVTSFADEVLRASGIYGLLMLKLFFVAMVVMACETLGHRRPSMGRKAITIVNLLTTVAVAYVVYALVLMNF